NLFENVLKPEYATHFFEQDNSAKRLAQLSNGWFVNINLNSKSAINNCKRYLEAVEIDTNDWEVECLVQLQNTEMDTVEGDFRGKKPKTVSFNGQKFERPEQTWRGLIVFVVNYIIEHDPQLFENKIVLMFSSLFTKDIANKRSYALL